MRLDRFKFAADVHIFLIENGQILLLRRYKTGFEDGKYSVIAGHRNKKETIKCTAAREAKEEAGVIIKPEDLQLIHVMHYTSKPNRIGFFFIARAWGGQPQNKEPYKCDDMRWFPLDQLPPKLIPYVKFAIEQFNQEVLYSEFEWPPSD